MISNNDLQWLRQKNLLHYADKISAQLSKVIQSCLKPKKEELLVIGDKGSNGKHIAALLAAGYYLGAKKLGLNAKFVLQEKKLRGEYADSKIVSAIEQLKKGSIIITISSGRLGNLRQLGKSYRNLAKKQEHRFISTANIGSLATVLYPFVVKAIDIDYKTLQAKCKIVKSILDKGSEVSIRTKLGTELNINIRGKKAICNDGRYDKKGTGGNIPAGEVYIAPKNVNGVVVIDCSSANRHGTSLVKKPMTMKIEDGEVVEIKGGEAAKKLRQSIEWACAKAKYPWGIKRIGELGIGLNPKARIVGATVVDEKTIGTAHVALGSNYWFGGTIYAIVHFDQVFSKPEIRIDGRLLKIRKDI